MGAIDAVAEHLGFHTLLARISEGNVASLRLCQALTRTYDLTLTEARSGLLKDEVDDERVMI